MRGQDQQKELVELSYKFLVRKLWLTTKILVGVSGTNLTPVGHVDCGICLRAWFREVVDEVCTLVLFINLARCMCVCYRCSRRYQYTSHTHTWFLYSVLLYSTSVSLLTSPMRCVCVSVCLLPLQWARLRYQKKALGLKHLSSKVMTVCGSP